MLWVFFLDYNLKNELFSSATQLAYHRDVEVYLQINNQSYKKTKKNNEKKEYFQSKHNVCYQILSSRYSFCLKGLKSKLEMETDQRPGRRLERKYHS